MSGQSDLELPGGRLAKTRRILRRDMWPDHEGYVGFVQEDEETGRLTTQVTLDAATYADMGSPNTITVSIEPGDRLNA